MSIFVKDLKTIKTNITGKELELKIPAAVWLYLESDYGISQSTWVEEFARSNSISAAKFFKCILKANKIETTLEDILDNCMEDELYLIADQYAILRFGEDYVNKLKNSNNEDESDSEGKL